MLLNFRQGISVGLASTLPTLGDENFLSDGICIKQPTPYITHAQLASTQTIELTGKVWKKQQLVAVSVLGIGVLMALVAICTSPINPAMALFGVVLVLIGGLWHEIVRGLIWWNHK